MSVQEYPCSLWWLWLIVTQNSGMDWRLSLGKWAGFSGGKEARKYTGILYYTWAFGWITPSKCKWLKNCDFCIEMQISTLGFSRISSDQSPKNPVLSFLLSSDNQRWPRWRSGSVVWRGKSSRLATGKPRYYSGGQSWPTGQPLPMPTCLTIWPRACYI